MDGVREVEREKLWFNDLMACRPKALSKKEEIYPKL